MMRILLDTNVLASFLTDPDASQQEAAAGLLAQAAENRIRLLLPQITATELVFVLTNLYGKPAGQTAQVLRELLDLPGLEVLEPLPWSRLLTLWPSQVPSFAHAALAALAQEVRADAVATFDKDFARRLKKLGIKVWA